MSLKRIFAMLALLLSISCAAYAQQPVTQGPAAANTAGWPVTAGGAAEVTATWTSSTAAAASTATTSSCGASCITVNTAGFTSVLVTINDVGTVTPGVLTYECSDTQTFTVAYGSSCQGVKTNATNAATVTLSTLQSNTITPIIFNVAGWAAFRIRVSTAITGSGTANVGATATNALGFLGPPLAVSSTSTVLSGLSQSASPDGLANLNYLPDAGNAHANPLANGNFSFGGTANGTANVETSGWGKNRACTIFKTVNVSATASGNTAVWTPTSGHYFRLLKYQVTASNLAATAATVITFSFQDGSTTLGTGTYGVLLPAAATATNLLIGGMQSVSDGWIDIGPFGIQSGTVSNVLNANVSATVTGATGSFQVNACGVEE